MNCHPAVCCSQLIDASGERRLLCVFHEDHSVTNHQQYNSGDQCNVSQHSSLLSSAYGPAKLMAQQGPLANCMLLTTMHEMGPRASWLDHGGAEERGLVGWIKIPDAPHWQLSTDMAITNRGYGTCIHCWVVTGHRWWWYAVGNVFLGHLRPDYPNSTILDSCQVSEHCFGPSFIATVFSAGDDHF